MNNSNPATIYLPDVRQLPHFGQAHRRLSTIFGVSPDYADLFLLLDILSCTCFYRNRDNGCPIVPREYQLNYGTVSGIFYKEKFIKSKPRRNGVSSHWHTQTAR